MNKILLYFEIRKFYNIFSEEVGECFITKLSDMTEDNVHDVLFDLNEVHGIYEVDCGVDDMEAWLVSLENSIIEFCNKKHPIKATISSCVSHINFEVCYAICFDHKTGEVKPYTKPIYNFFRWVYHKLEPNLFKNFYELHPDGQATLHDILWFYHDYTIYSIGNKDLIYVVDKKDCCIKCFESIGYEDDDCVPDIYQVFTSDLNKQFSYVADTYLEDGCTITKLQGGTK